MTNWPEYESHKIVRAAQITSIERDDHETVRRITVDPGDGVPEDFTPTVSGMADNAEVGAYAMLYPDGFRSISPRKQFEEGYTRRR